jgi:hypothetical protein
VRVRVGSDEALLAPGDVRRFGLERP